MSTIEGLEWRYVESSDKSHLFPVGEVGESLCGKWNMGGEPDEKQAFEDEPHVGDCTICHRRAMTKKEK